MPLSRRAALTAIAVTASGTFLPRWLLADTGLLLPGADVCTLTPATTEGPYYLDAGMVRQDIRDRRDGDPLTLRLQVVSPDCAPISGARVDIWHCDAQGVYSAFGAGRGETFLRGTQLADDRGVVEFQTIYPGWYPGRATHIHYKVWLDEHTVLTGQIFFPDAVSDAVYSEHPAYVRGRDRATRNDNDGIARHATDSAVAQVAAQKASHVAQLVIGVEA